MNLLYKIAEYRLRYEKKLKNDSYFVCYLAAILDYVERNNNGYLTEFGRTSLDFDLLKPMYLKLTGQIEGEKVTQKELIKFLLYISNCNKVCNGFKHIIKLYKENADLFTLNNALPDCVLNDIVKYEDKVFNLSDMFKNVTDSYITSLSRKYISVLEEEKNNSFITA